MSREAKRAASLRRANHAKRRIASLKQEVRSGRLGAEELLADPRARDVKILSLLSAIPRCSLETSLDALLACGINGARSCGDLSPDERRALAAALPQAGRGTAAPPRLRGARPIRGVKRELDLVLGASHRAQPVVELAPSEFAAARAGLGLADDPVLLWMVDRLVDAVRLYADRDDGGVRARTVAEQYVRFYKYRAKVASGEHPPPTLDGPPILE